MEERFDKFVQDMNSLVDGLRSDLFPVTPPQPVPQTNLLEAGIHPRICLNQMRLTRLKDFASRNMLRWQKVKAVAEAAIKQAPTTAQSQVVPALGLAYQITGDVLYAQKAIELMLQVAIPTNTLVTDRGYYYRTVIPEMSVGLDWCYDAMTSEQRKQIATWLMGRADAIWPDTNPTTNAYAADRPSNNYFTGYLMTWIAALAVHGDEPRADNHLQLALTKYQNILRPFFDGWGKGGVFAEGTGYDSVSRIALILDAYLTATGNDLVNDTDFLKDSLLWRIHATVPTRDLCYPLGDQARVSIAPLSDYDRMRAFIPMAAINDAQIRAMGKYWLDTIKPNISNWNFQVAWEFLYYDEDAPSADYTKVLPKQYIAEGPGVLLERSNWEPDATYWGIWSGPLREGHQNADVNGFMIYKGGWLIGNDTIWSHSGIMNKTISQNNTTFGGLGQTLQVPSTQWPDEAGKLIATEVTPDYTYFAGQGAQAYVQDRAHKGVKLLNDYTRKVVRIGDIFVIYDKTSPVDPTKPREWHLHSKNPVTANGKGYSFDNGKYRLDGQCLLPESANIASVPVVEGTTTIGYRLDVVSQSDHLVNVLQISPVGSPNLVPVTLLSANDNFASVKVGSKTISFDNQTNRVEVL